MQISKIIRAKIETEYLFLKGNAPINSKYFINKIEESISSEDNMNFKTNLNGHMTPWTYFKEDNTLTKFLLPIYDVIEQTRHKEQLQWKLTEAWGFRSNFAGYTSEHDHNPAFLSGAIMLTNSSQTLHFPQIGETLECKPGNFAVFSSYLLHRNYRTLEEKPRYGLSFNISQENKW